MYNNPLQEALEQLNNIKKTVKENFPSNPEILLGEEKKNMKPLKEYRTTINELEQLIVDTINQSMHDFFSKNTVSIQTQVPYYRTLKFYIDDADAEVLDCSIDNIGIKAEHNSETDYFDLTGSMRVSISACANGRQIKTNGYDLSDDITVFYLIYTTKIDATDIAAFIGDVKTEKELKEALLSVDWRDYFNFTAFDSRPSSWEAVTPRATFLMGLTDDLKQKVWNKVKKSKSKTECRESINFLGEESVEVDVLQKILKKKITKQIPQVRDVELYDEQFLDDSGRGTVTCTVSYLRTRISPDDFQKTFDLAIKDATEIEIYTFDYNKVHAWTSLGKAHNPDELANIIIKYMKENCFTDEDAYKE